MLPAKLREQYRNFPGTPASPPPPPRDCLPPWMSSPDGDFLSVMSLHCPSSAPRAHRASGLIVLLDILWVWTDLPTF